MFGPQRVPVTSVHACPVEVGSMPIGECELCGLEILAPRDVLVWADEHTYHQGCHQALLERAFEERATV